MQKELKLSVNNIYHNDWIIFDGRKFQIDITATEFPCLQTTEFGIGVVDWNNIKPIVLTPEVMERIEGVDVAATTYAKERYYIFDNIGVKFMGNKLWKVTYGGQKLDIDNIYLHTIQQLIRLFTGKEIEVKWENQ